MAGKGRRHIGQTRPGGRTLMLAGVVLLFVAPPPARAQVEQRLTLEACIQQAIERNGILRQSVAQARASKGDYVSAWSNVLPSVGARVERTQVTRQASSVFVGNQRFPIPPRRSVQDDYSLSASISQPLIDLPGYFTWRQRKTSWEGARERVRSSRQDVALAVVTNFYDVVAGDRLAEVRREALQLARDQAERSQALFDLGAVPKADVLKAQVAVSQAQRELIDAENAAVLARGRLNVALGNRADLAIEVVYQPQDVPDPLPLPAGGVREALGRRPDVKESELAVESAKQAKRSAWWSTWPTVRASLFWGRSVPLSEAWLDFESLHDLRQEASWGYGITLSVPIFDGLVTKGQKVRAAGTYNASTEGLTQLTREAELEIRETRLNIGAARASMALSRDAVASAEENLRLREAMYDHGAATILELIQAQVDLTNARYDQIVSETVLQYAWQQYRKAIGIDLVTGEPF